MGYQSRADFVAAAANAGIFASLASALFNSGIELREEIKKTKDQTDQSFGININLFPMLRQIDNEEYINIALEEGVRVIETSGRSPEPLVPLIKNAGARLMHKCARIRDARKAKHVGADVVEVMGLEYGGHPSREQVGTLVLVPQVVEAVTIPVLAGGGIADARGLVSVMALGAEGAVLGTRFLATRECPIHDDVKQRLIAATSTDTTLAISSLTDPMRALRTDLTNKVEELENNGAPSEEIFNLIAGDKSMRALSEGDVKGALLACGQSVGMVQDIPTVAELVNSMMSDALVILDRLRGIFTGVSS
jgi:nitronate monooxygenase